jgi:hypothetical protein
MNRLISLTTFAIVGCGLVLAEEPSTSFTDPPRSVRILKIIHGWPDRDEAQDALLDRLDRQGFGGVVSNVSFRDYLESEPMWRAFRRGIEAARGRGMAQWLYDERGYPSGEAGGLVLRDHPDWEAEGLLIADARTSGSAVALTSPPGELVFAAAFPERDGRADLSGRIDLAGSLRDGKLDWTPTIPGAWRVLVVTRSRLFEGSHADSNLFDHIPYPNLLRPEPTRRFVDLTHAAYTDRFGADLKETFQAVFTDEPSLMSFFYRPMPYKPLPWAPALPREFRERRGYDLDPIIPELILDAGPEGARHRHDFWRTIAELIAENYFGRLQAWGRANGVPSGGHLILEESPTSHVANYGDMMRCLRLMDAPGIDCLTSAPSEVPWQAARLAASAAELEGRELVMCETSDHMQHYRPKGDDRPRRPVSEAEIRGTIHRLMLGGVNCVTSYYSFDGLDDAALNRLNVGAGRIAMTIRGGRQAADVAVVYPIESLWTRFEPSRHMSSEATAANRVETLYNQALDRLYRARRDPTILDARALIEAEVEGDSLRLRDHRWRVVVLPGVDTLPAAAWAKLATFAEAGGVVVAIGERPRNSDSRFPDPTVVGIGEALFGPESAVDLASAGTTAAGGGGLFLPDASAVLLPAAIDAVLAADVAAAPSSPIRATHRRIGDEDVYLIANDSNETVAEPIRLPVDAGTDLKIGDPSTGETRTIAAGDRGAVAVELGPYEALLIRAASVRPRERRPLKVGGLPGVELRKLDLPRAVVGRGEFVRETVAEADGATTFRATIVKGDVNVHLFASFTFPAVVDFSDADGLVVDTTVPADQRTPTQLLIVLRATDGGEFLAQSARSLAAPGPARAFVPWSSFSRPGWSRKGSDVLDPARVAEVRVGWGGYFGAEGEVVEFRLDGLSAAAVKTN